MSEVTKNQDLLQKLGIVFIILAICAVAFYIT
mgnify:CR=1 FL=1